MPAARSTPSLIERDAVLERIEATLGQDEGGVVLVEGAAGIGKTTVLGSVRRPDAATVRATAHEGSLAWPFGLLVDALSPVVHGGAEALLAGAAAAAAPLFSVAEVDVMPEDPLALAAARQHALVALLGAISGGGETSLVLVLDDLHWADDASLGVLLRLATSPVPGVGVVAATRPVHGRGVLDRLRAAATVEPLGPLSPAGVSALLELRGASGVDGASVATATGGNPFLVTELAIALEDSAPEADLLAGVAERAPSDLPAGASPEPFAVASHVPLPAAVARRITGRLLAAGSDAHRFAVAVAVLGREATLGRAATLAELDLADAALLSDRLTVLEILAGARDPAIAHPLVTEAVLGALGQGELGLLRLAAARLLLAEGVPAGRVAGLLIEAPPVGDRAVAAALATAGRAASAAGAPTEAIRLLARAIEEPPAEADRADVRLALAEARASAGDPAAETDYLLAIAGTRGLPRVRAQLSRAHGLLNLGSFAAAATAAREAVADLPDDLDPLMRRDLVASASLAQTFALAPVELAEWVRHLEPPHAGGATSGERRRFAHAALSGTLSSVIDGPRARELCAWALDDGRLLRDPQAGGTVISLVTGAWFATGDFAQSVDACSGALESARARGAAHDVAILHYLRAAPLFALGRLDASAEDARTALESLDPAGSWALGARCLLALARVEEDAVDEAQELLAGARSGEEIPGIARQVLLVSRAAGLLAAGDPATALAVAEAAGRLMPPTHENPGMTISQWRCVAARALAMLGRAEEATELAEFELEAAKRWGAAHAKVGPLIALGLARGGDEGLRVLREAVSQAAGGSHQVLRADALVQLGSAQRRAGQRAEARETLYDARALAHGYGLRRLGRLAEEELAAAGARPRGAAASDADALTASELRVARLAADGRSNRQIAGGLFVSVKTVEYHLRNAYRKLGVQRRAELAAALERSDG